MNTKGRKWTVARQIAFFAPADSKGKWHAAWKVTRTPVCGAAVELSESDVIRTTAGQSSANIHPICCRTCVRLSTPAGYTASGYIQ